MKLKILGWTVRLLQNLFDMQKLDCRQSELRELPVGSVGKEVADLLDSQSFKLIPKFPNHDLKHVVLGYDMTLDDEIRMQAYLVGNGNNTWPCLLFFSLGIFKPSIWGDLVAHFKQGERSPSIFHLALHDVQRNELKQIQGQFGRR